MIQDNVECWLLLCTCTILTTTCVSGSNCEGFVCKLSAQTKNKSYKQYKQDISFRNWTNIVWPVQLLELVNQLFTSNNAQSLILKQYSVLPLSKLHQSPGSLSYLTKGARQSEVKRKQTRATFNLQCCYICQTHKPTKQANGKEPENTIRTHIYVSDVFLGRRTT